MAQRRTHPSRTQRATIADAISATEQVERRSVEMRLHLSEMTEAVTRASLMYHEIGIRLFPTETMRRLAGIFISQAESVTKGAQNYDQAKGLDAAKTVMDGSYTANLKAFTEKWSNLMQALGAPIVA